MTIIGLEIHVRVTEYFSCFSSVTENAYQKRTKILEQYRLFGWPQQMVGVLDKTKYSMTGIILSIRQEYICGVAMKIRVVPAVMCVQVLGAWYTTVTQLPPSESSGSLCQRRFPQRNDGHLQEHTNMTQDINGLTFILRAFLVYQLLKLLYLPHSPIHTNSYTDGHQCIFCAF